MAEEADLKQKDLLKLGMVMWKLKPFVREWRRAVEGWGGAGSYVHELLVQPRMNLSLCLHLSPGHDIFIYEMGM